MHDEMIERVILTREVIELSRAMMRQVDELLANGYGTAVRPESRGGQINDPGDWPSRASPARHGGPNPGL
jgi:hypothetical protein